VDVHKVTELRLSHRRNQLASPVDRIIVMRRKEADAIAEAGSDDCEGKLVEILAPGEDQRIDGVHRFEPMSGYPAHAPHHDQSGIVVAADADLVGYRSDIAWRRHPTRLVKSPPEAIVPVAPSGAAAKFSDRRLDCKVDARR